jgi:membrane-associated phospholipid phosphatase
VLALALQALVPSVASASGWMGTLWDRTQRAVAASSTDPAVWAPLAGALLLQAGSADADIARWIGDETPLFGNAGSADRASDVLRDATEWTQWSAATARVLGTPADTWALHGANSAALGYAGYELNQTLTDGVKARAGRMRPDGSDRLSFPSGHTSTASVRAALTWQHLRRSELPPWGLRTIGWTATGLAVTTAWARLEAGKHYPSDVLVGWAMGRWVGHFLGELLLGAPAGLHLVVAPASSGQDGWTVELTAPLPSP